MKGFFRRHLEKFCADSIGREMRHFGWGNSGGRGYGGGAGGSEGHASSA